MSGNFKHREVVSLKFGSWLRKNYMRHPFIALKSLNKLHSAFHGFPGRGRCFIPLASGWPCPKLSSVIPWPHLFSLVLKKFKRLLRRWKCQTPRVPRTPRTPKTTKASRTPIGGKPKNTILFSSSFKILLFVTLFFLKLLDIWPVLSRQHFPCLHSFLSSYAETLG